MPRQTQYKPTQADWMSLLVILCQVAGITLPTTKTGKLTSQSIGWLRCHTGVDFKDKLDVLVPEVCRKSNLPYSHEQLTQVAQYIRVNREIAKSGTHKYKGDLSDLEQAYRSIVGVTYDTALVAKAEVPEIEAPEVELPTIEQIMEDAKYVDPWGSDEEYEAFRAFAKKCYDEVQQEIKDEMNRGVGFGAKSTRSKAPKRRGS